MKLGWPACLVAALASGACALFAAGDPVLTYSTYLGGSGVHGDSAAAIALDAGGNIYLAGSTSSGNLPNAVGAFSGGTDAFVMKLNPSGTAVLYTRYLGGNGHDTGLGIAVDSGGNAYVTGTTSSVDFPVTGGALRTTPAGELDGFVTKLDATGGLVYSTYLGGSDADAARSIAIEGNEAVVAGFTESTDFPTTSGSIQGALRGAADAFVVRLNAAGTALVYGTYLGGTDSDRAFGVALDSSGNAYVAGSTASSDFPVTGGAEQTFLAGAYDGFVAKISAGGDALVYATYLGGSGGDEVSAIAVDNAGFAFVTGNTASADFPATAGVKAGALDAFAAKVNAAGSGLTYSRYLGGVKSDLGEAIALDGSGNAHVTGNSRSPDFAITTGAIASAYAGGDDALLFEVGPTGNLVRSSFLGGTAEESGSGVVIDNSGQILVTGHTLSTNFPVTPDALQAAAAGAAGQAFLVKIGGTTAPLADLRLAVTVTPNPVAMGANATYVFTVTNLGPAAATSVRIADILPSAMSFVSCSATAGGSCQGSGANRQALFSTLGAGVSASATLVAKIGAALADGTPVVNTGSVTSGLLDPDRGNNYASATTTATLGETVSAPVKPAGTTAGIAGTAYTYSASGATSSSGHTLQYRFDWGDGTDSGWLPAGTRTAPKTWDQAAMYSVRAAARCATHADAVSGPSPLLAVTVSYSISGRVTLSSGAGIGSVTITLSGSKSGSATTNSSGNYVIKGLSAGGNYTVKSTKSGYSFNPVNRSFSSLGSNQAANFTGTLVYKISGRITRSNGTSISAVTVKLSGSQTKTAQTDSAGNYSFPALPKSGNYTVTPSKTGYSFTPASRSYAGLSANKTAGFTGKAN